MRSCAAILTAIFALAVAVVSAQTSQLSGTVRDRSGAVLPGVTVAVEGLALEKGRIIITTTDSRGQFTFSGLPIDDAYVVTFSLTGFQTVTRRKVAIFSDKATTADAIMLVDMSSGSPSKSPSRYGIVLIAPQQ